VDEFFAEGRWREYVDELCDVYRTRRDAMLESLERHFPPEATWSEPEGGLFLWATLPDFIDTTDLLARALRDNVAFVPGVAAFADGVTGKNSMRLNFSGSTEDEIREGIRRIGAVVAEQMALYGAITREHGVVGGRAAEQGGSRGVRHPGAEAGSDALVEVPDPGAAVDGPDPGAQVLPMRRREPDA